VSGFNDGSVFAPNDPNGRCIFTGQGNVENGLLECDTVTLNNNGQSFTGNGPNQGGETGTIVTITTGHTAGLEG